MTTFDPKELISGFGHIGHSGLLGFRYHEHGPDWVALELPWRPELVGDPATNVIASGPILTMMDMVTSLSVWIKTGQFRPQATLDLRVDYLRPAEPGKALFGRGQCYKVTRSIAFVRGEAHDGDPNRLVAHVAGTYAFTDA